MPYEEDYRRPYKSKCACGKGIVRRYCITELNDWGQIREKYTDPEIHCDYCRAHYHYEKNNVDWIEYLVPNGLSFPKSLPRIDNKYSYSDAEKFVAEHDKTIIEKMIEDMSAPKHRFIKDLTYKPAIEFANNMVAWYRKKSLEPMLERLRSYLSRYDELLSTYNRKKPRNDLYEEQLHKYNKDLETAELKSFRLSFSFDKEKDDENNNKSQSEAEIHKFDSFQAIVNYHSSCKMDLTGSYWDSFYIKSCIDPEFLILEKAGFAIPQITIVKKYECICSICGNKKDILSNEFEIEYDEGNGYYPKVSCDCHNVSSFEAKTMDILNHIGINYIRELSFDNLVGDSGKPLRFDFALYDNKKLDSNSKPQYKLLIELQGPHHFKPGRYNKDGVFIEDNTNAAKSDFDKWVKYDERKKTYCKKIGLALEYIKYTSQQNYDELEVKIKKLLEKYGFTCM